MLGMSIDFITNTITVTKAFREASREYGTEEYIALSMAMSENPNMKVVTRSVRTGARKNDNKGLTYKYMRKFISVMDSNNLLAFEKAILYYEGFGYSNVEVYQNVKDWFLNNYPDHKNMIAVAVPQRENKDAA